MSKDKVRSTTHQDPENYLTGQKKYHTIISEDKGLTKKSHGEGHGTTREQSQENASKDYEKNKK